MKTNTPHSLADMETDDLKELLELQVPTVDNTETDEAGLSLADVDEDDDFNDLDIDEKYQSRPMVLIERDTEIVKSNLANALRLYEAQQIKYRHIGQMSYTSADAKTIAIRDAGPILDAADTVLMEETEPLVEELRQIIKATKNAREESLSDSDYSAAGSRKAFVQEDCETLPLRDLIKKVQNSLAIKDTAALWLYARYGKIRVANPRETERDQIQARDTLKTLVDSVSERFLDRRNEPVHARAKALLQEVRDLQKRVYDRRTAQLLANPAAAPARYHQM